MQPKGRILIIIDAEGSLGFEEFYEDGGSKAMENELACVVPELIKRKYDITIVDAHANGDNINRAKGIYKNINIVRHIWGLREFDFDKAAILGMHPKAGDKGRFSHTLRSEIAEVLMGDRIVGEAALITNWLAFYSIPVVFMAGSQGVENEVDELGIHYYAHTKSEDSLKRMVKELFVELTTNHTRIAYCKESVSMRFKDELFMEFIPPFLGDKKDGYIIFPNTKYLIDVFPCISVLLEAAHSFRNSTLCSLRVRAKENKGFFDEFSERFGPLMNRNFRRLGGDDIRCLLDENSKIHCLTESQNLEV